MEDDEILNLYWERVERAIEETEKKYGNYCFYVAMRILCSPEDSNEIVNDTMLAAWNSIPPHRPEILRTYLGKISRNLSLKRFRNLHAKKRGEGELPIALEEISESVSDGKEIIERLEAKELAEIIADFLRGEKSVDRQIFLYRYFYFESIENISKRSGYRKSRIKSILFRMRKRLGKRLAEEGYYEE